MCIENRNAQSIRVTSLGIWHRERATPSHTPLRPLRSLRYPHLFVLLQQSLAQQVQDVLPVVASLVRLLPSVRKPASPMQR